MCRLTKSDTRFAIRCRKCLWQGCSSQVHGGYPIADTGDYSELQCPICDSIHLNDEVKDSLNIWLWLVHWAYRPIVRIRQTVYVWQLNRYLARLDKEFEDDTRTKTDI